MVINNIKTDPERGKKLSGGPRMMVDQEKLAKQTIAFYKKTFESTFTALDMIQDQTQRMLKMQLDLMTGMPEEGKRVISEWMKVYKKGCDEFKTAVDDKFKQVESYFSEAGAGGKGRKS
jgi:hypothetical protein